MFITLSQPRANEKSQGVDVECIRSLDRFLLFVTLGQAFLFVALVGGGPFVWSMRYGRVMMMPKQGVIAAVAFLAAMITKAASGQALEEVLVYLGALVRGFAPSVVR